MELTIEQIIAKKDECVERFKTKYVKIGSQFLGGSIKFQSLSRGDLADIREMLKNDTEKGLLYFIYLSSETLREKALLKAYGCDKGDTWRIVERLFNDSERAKVISMLEELNGLTSTNPDAIFKDEVEDLKKLIEGDIDLYTYAHYLDRHGMSLTELQQSSSLERMFYTASMLVMKKEKMENDIALAKLSNPFLEKKK